MGSMHVVCIKIACTYLYILWIPVVSNFCCEPPLESVCNIYVTFDPASPSCGCSLAPSYAIFNRFVVSIILMFPPPPSLPGASPKSAASQLLFSWSSLRGSLISPSAVVFMDQHVGLRIE